MMRLGMDPLQLALARLVIEDQPTEELLDLAADALVRGIDTPALRQLAGTLRTEVRDARDRFLRAVEELGWRRPADEAARRTLVRYWAEQMLAGKLTPYEASRLIWKKASWQLPQDADLMVFVGLASEWEDHPDYREDLEIQMLDEAQRIIHGDRTCCAAVERLTRHHVRVSRWKMLKTWDRDLPGLTREQLEERLTLAREYEADSARRGIGRAPKARREWRRRRESVEAEFQRRFGSEAP
jgi:hypothetical protein